jgi:hypothetical protein
MPRARQNVYARPSRIYGAVSGVTFETNPSGVSISKNQIAMDGGQVLPDTQRAAGTLIATGAVNNSTSSGVTKIEASYFGFSAILFCMAGLGVTNSQTGAVSCQVTVTTAKPIPATGVSRVYFRTLNALGALTKKPVSVQYFAVGV